MRFASASAPVRGRSSWNSPSHFGVSTGMTRALVLWAAATALAGCLAGQQRPLYVSPQFQERKLISRVRPVYPPLAKQMRIEGPVELAVWISADGEVKEIRFIRGHPLLVKAAIDAVSRWRYRPTWWLGQWVEVVTRVTVNFSLRSSNSPDGPGASAAEHRAGRVRSGSERFLNFNAESFAKHSKSLLRADRGVTNAAHRAACPLAADDG